MNAELIKNILTIVSASIPLLLAIVTLVGNRPERTNEPLDTSLLRIINITRLPLDQEDWIRRRKKSRLKNIMISIIMLFIAISVIIAGILSFTILPSNRVFLIIYVVVGLIVYLFVSYRFNFLHKNPAEIRYNLFKDALILIEADYHYLFSKCHEALRSMNLKVVEINERIGNLEAFQQGGLFATGRTLQVQVKQSKLPNTYLIWVQFGLEDISISPKEIRSIIPEANQARSSKVINRFINQLISKPKSADQKTDDKKDVPTEVGD
jgi:hypothetical protein